MRSGSRADAARSKEPGRADLPRLADLLADDAGPAPVTWRLAGGASADGRAALTVALDVCCR